MKTANDNTIGNLRVSSAGGLALLLMLAEAMNVVAAPTIIPNPPIQAGPTWKDAVGPLLYGVDGDTVEALLPLAIVCALSLLCTALWLLFAETYRQKHL